MSVLFYLFTFNLLESFVRTKETDAVQFTLNDFVYYNRIKLLNGNWKLYAYDFPHKIVIRHHQKELRRMVSSILG